MAAELMVINPVKRRKRRAMSAKQRRYFGKRSRPRVTRARRNPVAAASAPRRVRRRRFPRTRATVSRYYRRARSSNMGSLITSKLLPAGIGAAGAFALDMAWDRLPIPPNLKVGPMAPLVRIAGAFGIGYVAKMVGGKSFGDEATMGALTVTLYDLAKQYMAPQVPATPATVNAYVRGLGYNSAAYQAGNLNAYVY